MTHLIGFLHIFFKKISAFIKRFIIIIRNKKLSHLYYCIKIYIHLSKSALKSFGQAQSPKMQTKYRLPYKNLLSKKINESSLTYFPKCFFKETYEFILLGR